jgi:hypothetical protein
MKAMPFIDELNEEGHDVLKLDLDEPDNKTIQQELKQKYKIQCGTPLFINADTGHHVCGYREKDILLKWINGEDVPPPPRPKGPMPRVPFHGVAKKEVNKWKKEYLVWADENSHLPNLRTVDDLLATPRPKSNAPAFPSPTATEVQMNTWKTEYRLWVKQNKHLKNLATAEAIIERSKQQRAAQVQRNVGNIMLEERVKVIETKLDKLLNHLGVK